MIPAVVLQYGRLELTAGCLASLREQSVQVEITLIDNHSPNADPSTLQRLIAMADRHMLLAENLGYARGNNVALRELLEGSSEYVLIVNNDTVVEPTCVAELVRFAREVPDAGQVCPRVVYADGRLQAAGGRIREDLFEPQLIGHGETGDFDEPARVTYAPGMAMLVRTAAIRQSGLMPEEYFLYGEDVAWSLALADHGWTVWYAPEAKVAHHESAATGLFHPRKGYYLTRANVLLARQRLNEERFRDFARTYRLKLVRQTVKHAMHPRYVAACWRGARDGFRGVSGRTV